MGNRNANHQGSVTYIESRKNTKPWRVRLMRDGVEHTKYFTTKKEAEAYRNKIATGDITVKKRSGLQSFQVFCEETWLPQKKEALKPRSYNTVEHTCTCYVFKHIGMMALGQIGNKEVQEMVNEIAKAGYSKSIVNKCKNAATNCLRFAAANGYIDSFPVVSINMPSQEKYPNLIEKEKEWFTEDEMNRYVAECYRTYSNGKPKHPNGPMYALILHTGIREGEAFGLEWSDFDENGYRLHITKNVVGIRDDNGKHRIIMQHTPKSKAGNRVINLNKQAVRDLEALKQLNGNYPYIMANKKGGLMASAPFLEGHYRICRAAGLRITSVHSLRHSYVTYRYYKGLEALKQGKHFDPRDLAKEVGHANLRTMYEIYTHLSLKADISESRNFEDLDEF